MNFIRFSEGPTYRANDHIQIRKQFRLEKRFPANRTAAPALISWYDTETEHATEGTILTFKYYEQIRPIFADI